MRCKKCQTEFEDKDLQTTWYDNGVVFRLVCHSLECDYYYETQISGAATMYIKQQTGLQTPKRMF